MQKLEAISAGKIFRIVQTGNGDGQIFFEPANKKYFLMLAVRHLVDVCEILEYDLSYRRIELVLRFKPEGEIPENYRRKLHLPLLNLFNSYTKSINKRYGRQGSLFKKKV